MDIITVMRVRYLGSSPAYNADVGYVEPDGIYDVPQGREDAFTNAFGDWEVV